jgi:hypothetical protein
MKAHFVGMYFLMASSCLAGFEPFETFTNLLLHASILEADVILVADTNYVPLEETSARAAHLYRLDNVEVLFGKDWNGGSQAFVVTSAKHSFGRPVIVPNLRHLLFLKHVEWGSPLRGLLGLAENTILFEPCKGWQSSILLDFSRKSLAAKLLKEKYSVHDENRFVAMVKELCAWRKLPKGKRQVFALLELLNAKTGETFYVDNITRMLTSLGASVTNTNGQYILVQ